ncbi:MAG TPA: ATP-binding protein [Gaiellaceae bacterium]|nr:ATP-binding protein [Gaiellaceae bacterium]
MLSVRFRPPPIRGEGLHALVVTVGVINSVSLVVLAAVAIRLWLTRRARATGWLALAFLAMGLLVTVGRLVPAHPHGFFEYLGQRLDIELLVLFPYLLYRFATTFVAPGLLLRRFVPTLTVGLTVFTFALPDIPAAGESWSIGFALYVIAFFVHWTLLSVTVTARLLGAGRGQPSVSAKRMQMLAFAAATLTIALLGTTFATNQASLGAFVVQLIGFVAIIGFYLGIDPPQIVRAYWRTPEQARLQEAIRGLVTLAVDRPEIAARIAGPAAGLVGARGLVVVDAEGKELAVWGEPGPDRGVVIAEEGLTFIAWTSPYAPFFGEDDLRALHTIAGLTATALDRVRLFEQEHATRLALERANELMTNFVALAAHELRTPVTTIHGFVQTLNHVGTRLSEVQKVELREALEQQTHRMAALVEQLLDLTRLDAEAVDVRPQLVEVEPRLREVVALAAAGRDEEIEVTVPGHASARVDPQILDHVVTNLVTNALRYGQAPVRVTAIAEDGCLRVAVEDSGPGVAREIEETLFDRFTRAGVARDRVAGAGLGLAIARAYARAHSGDLRYERGDPSGARFVVDLPAA